MKILIPLTTISVIVSILSLNYAFEKQGQSQLEKKLSCQMGWRHSALHYKVLTALKQPAAIHKTAQEIIKDSEDGCQDWKLQYIHR